MTETIKNLAIYDDDVRNTGLLVRCLSPHGYDVVLTAETLAQALATIDSLAKLQVRAALVDKFLPDGDGDAIAAAINSLGLNIAVIGIGSQYDVKGAWTNIRKGTDTKVFLSYLATLG